jgi:peroxiredoxin
MAEKTKPISAGETAPDFTLRDQDANKFTLSAQKGKRVLLSFHPLAFTGFCTLQMLSIEVNYENFTSLNTVPVGLSVDSLPSKEAWAREMKLKDLKILSDFWPTGAVAKAYGLFRDKHGTAQRANVIVDEKGKVAWVKVYEVLYLPDVNEVLAVLKKMAGNK